MREWIKKTIKDIGLYAVVGGIATIAEWIIFFFTDQHFHYEVSVIIAYLLSTFVNWFAGRLLLFKESRMKILIEIGSIYLTCLGGLGLNLLIMWIFVSGVGLRDMISKVLATAIVFFYNYGVRRKLIYR